MNSRTRNTIRVVVAVVLFIPCALYIGWAVERSRRVHCEAVARHPDCVNNLRQIGLAFRVFAIDNGGRFPFNLSTKSGGTLELCQRGSDGFDSNAAIHFQLASNELSTPRLLVCPKDHSRKPAATFSLLTAVNVTYRLRTGTNITEGGPRQLLADCPIDGNKLYSDGSLMDSEGHAVAPFHSARLTWQTNRWLELPNVTPEERADLARKLTGKIKPAVEKWCKAYRNQVPFRPEALTLDSLKQRAEWDSSSYYYTFILGGTELAVRDSGGSVVVMFMYAPEAKQLTALPKEAAPDLHVPVAKGEVIQMVKSDSGLELKPQQVVIRPTGAATAVSGGAFVDIVPHGGDPNKDRRKIGLIFGANGNLIYYYRDPYL